jgi:hypothetical protein
MKHLKIAVVALGMALPGVLLAAGPVTQDPIAAAAEQLARADAAGDTDAIGRALLRLADAYEAQERFDDAEATHRERLAWAIDGTTARDAPAVAYADLARFYARWGDHAAAHDRPADAELAYSRAIEAGRGNPLLAPGFDRRVADRLARVYDVLGCSRDPAQPRRTAQPIEAAR